MWVTQPPNLLVVKLLENLAQKKIDFKGQKITAIN